MIHDEPIRARLLLSSSLSLLSLPIGIHHVIFRQFLCNLNDMSRLDVAYCTHTGDREKLMSVLSNDIIKYDHIIVDNKTKKVDNALVWIGKRMINITSLSCKGIIIKVLILKLI